MADNIAITAGSGTSVATDDVSGVHYQRVKVATGADGAATDIALLTPIYAAQAQVADVIVQRITNTDGAASAVSSFGATASKKNCITTLIVYNSSATDGYVDVTDGSGGTVICTIPLPKVGGAVIHFNPPLVQPTANTGLYIDVSAALSTIYLSFVGFKA